MGKIYIFEDMEYWWSRLQGHVLNGTCFMEKNLHFRGYGVLMIQTSRTCIKRNLFLWEKIYIFEDMEYWWSRLQGHVLNGTCFYGKNLHFRGYGVLMIQTSSICIKWNLLATVKFSALCSSFTGRFHSIHCSVSDEARHALQFPPGSLYVTVSADNHTSLQVTVQSIRSAHQLQRSPFFELIFH